MKNVLSLRMTRSRALPSFDPLGVLLRLDAGYRDARKREEATREQLLDMGIERRGGIDRRRH